MISRADFVFTIGYEGSTAVVDGALKRRYGHLSTEGLAEEGLYKQALCSAIYENSDLQKVLDLYNRKTLKKVSSIEEFKRLFGVFEVPEGPGKVQVI